jgi:hypothetical protein
MWLKSNLHLFSSRVHQVMSKPLPQWSFEFKTDQWSQWLNRWQTKYLANTYEVTHDYFSLGYRARVERGSRLIQIVVFPSWDPIFSYEVFSTNNFSQKAAAGFRYLLLKTTWDFEADFARWKADKTTERIPRLECVWIGLEQEQADEITEQLKVDLPAHFDPFYIKTGTDGTLFEVNFGNRFLGITYRWWSRAPAEWQPLQASVDKTILFLEQLLQHPHAEHGISSQ